MMTIYNLIINGEDTEIEVDYDHRGAIIGYKIEGKEFFPSLVQQEIIDLQLLEDQVP